MGNVPRERIEYLFDKMATRENMLDALYDVFTKALEKDLVIVYFALHGVPSEDELYFLPYEGDPRRLVSTGVAQSDLMKLIKSSRAKRIVMIIDACHAGKFGDMISAREIWTVRVANFLEELSKTRPSVAVISASSAGELSYEDAKWGNHGVFTYYLLRGLRGEADQDNDGYVRLRELYSYIYKKVHNATMGKQNPDIDGEFDNNLPLSIVR